MDTLNDSPNSNQSPLLKYRKFVFVIAAVLVVAVVIVLVLQMRTKDTTQPAGPLPEEITVELTDDGFVPQEVTIKRGAAVRWVNNASDEQVSVNSADHPNHQKYPELNLGTFPKGSTVVHIFEQSGEYEYHDHFHPERTGKVIVQ